MRSAFEDACRGASRLSEPTTALYVSAGRDTAPLTFMHAEHFAAKGVGDVPSPDVLVYVDRSSYAETERPLTYEDDRTSIRCLDSRPIAIGDLQGHTERLSFRSDTYADREYTLIRLCATNQAFGARAARSGWVPDFLVTVCCGCAGFGGNTRCEVEWGLPGTAVGFGPSYRWLVSDHIKRMPVQGDEPALREHGCPVELRPIAMLSGCWRGPHGLGGNLAGATLFGLDLLPLDTR